MKAKMKAKDGCRVLGVVITCWLLFLGASSLFGQVSLPQSAQVDLYFPHFANGGPVTGQWQTTFTFSNPNNSSASVTLFLVSDNGQPLQIDFGKGPSSQLSLSVPAWGTSTITSRIGSAVITTGWAEAVSSLPLQGVVSFRFLRNGVPSQEISVPSTLPTNDFFSQANAFLGLAVANVYSATSISLLITARGNDGLIKQGNITIPPLAHQSFNLSQVIPNLAPNFVGTVELVGVNLPLPYFVALTLKADRTGMFSSLPAGNFSLPIAHENRIGRVFAKIRDVASSSIPDSDSIQLTISSDPRVNALGEARGITIYLALAELISDSESELASVVAHELGHVYQYRTGSPHLLFNSNIEFDADIWGLLLSLRAGYDPYASAGALAKLAMATGKED